MERRRGRAARVQAPDDVMGLAARTGADLVEVRLDLLGVTTPEGARPWGHPGIVALRSTAHGGAFEGTPAQAATVLVAAAASHAARSPGTGTPQAGALWVDAEPQVLAHLDLSAHRDVRLLVSCHDQEPEPPDEGPRKIARRVDDAHAWARFLDDARASDPETTWVPYGGLACARTMFVGHTGTTLLYGAASDEGGVVAGQPSLRALRDELRAGEVSLDAQLFGLVGTPPAWSPSPALHNTVFRMQDRDALFVPFSGMSLDAVLDLPVGGVAVTHPFKPRAFELAKTHSAEARATGIVNTLVPARGGLEGHNTDALGVARLVDPAGSGDTALVYGAGATARSAVYALKSRGYGVRVSARDSGKAHALAEAMGCAVADGAAPSDRVVVNATPAGATAPLPELLATLPLEDLHIVDAPYRATGQVTDLVARARAAGARCSGGRAFLVAQAIEQVRLFGGPEGSRTLDAALHMAVQSPPALWLVGPRGSGKTTVGRQVARRLGRPFVDLDAEVERVSGETSARLIERGWQWFRAMESGALRTALPRRGVVVATGGGIVEDEESPSPRVVDRHALLTDQLVVWLDAPPACVIARRRAVPGERPRWPGAATLADEVRLLDERRRDLYERWSHVRVDASRAVEDVVYSVTDAWLSHVSLV